MPRTPVDGLLPHRPPILLVEELLDYDPLWADASGRVRDDCPFLRADGALHPLAGIEIVAQAAAALQGALARDTQAPAKAGLLVGVRDYRVAGVLRKGDSFRTEVRKSAEYPPLSVIEGRLWSGDTQIASGSLRVVTTEAVTAGASHAALPRAERGKSMPESRVDARSDVRMLADGSLEANFCLSADYPAFSGHFPGRPVLPAVSIGILAVEIARTAAAEDLAGLTSAKFSRVVVPGDRLDIACARNGSGQWSARAAANGESAAELRFRFAGAPGR